MYLSRLGWEITVVTPDPTLWTRVDHEYLSENNVELENIRRVYTGHKWRCLDPTNLRCWSDGIGRLYGGVVRVVARRLSVDNGLGWIKPAEKACNLLTRNDFDIILATGRPFAAFELAGRLARKFGRPYVLDYRDPWTWPSPRQWPNRIARQEDVLLKAAAAAITVSPTWGNAIRDRFQLENKIHVITNGYEPEEMDRVVPYQFDHFAIVYAGMFYPPRRVIAPLMAALNQLKSHRTNWYFHYYGNHQSHVAEEAAKYDLTDRVVVHGYVPRKECLSAIKGASVSLVLNPVNPIPTGRDLGWIPGKLFEPLGLCTPILFIGAPEGDAAKIVKQTGGGGVFSAQNIDNIASFLSGLMDNKAIPVSGCDAYSWLNLVKKFDRVLRMSAGISSPSKSEMICDDAEPFSVVESESVLVTSKKVMQ
jgi:glycosyltransferase involved in cell wall biosynthesis